MNGWIARSLIDTLAKPADTELQVFLKESEKEIKLGKLTALYRV